MGDPTSIEERNKGQRGQWALKEGVWNKGQRGHWALKEGVCQQGRWASKGGGLGDPTSIGEGNECQRGRWATEEGVCQQRRWASKGGGFRGSHIDWRRE